MDKNINIVEIKRVASVLSCLENDFLELEKAKHHLSKRRDNLNSLLNGSEYDKNALRSQLEMIPVEERRVDDLMCENRRKMTIYSNAMKRLTSIV
jgi:dsDNA-specific endonuclease/ATPase MutS2